MKQYIVTWAIEVSVPGDSKGDAERAARELVYANPDEFNDMTDYVSCDPICVNELDEHGDPIL